MEVISFLRGRGNFKAAAMLKRGNARTNARDFLDIDLGDHDLRVRTALGKNTAPGIDDEAVAKGVATVSGSLDRLVKKEKITAADKEAALARIKTSTSYDDLKAAQLVIEAATENFELKCKILKQLDGMLAPEVLVAPLNIRERVGVLSVSVPMVCPGGSDRAGRPARSMTSPSPTAR